jgi:archaellum component FlaF (FlaF/FlaG flagellin family)
MEHAIPSMIIGMLLLIASAFTAQSSLGIYDDLSHSLKEMESRIGEQSRTRTSIVSATLDPNGHTLNVSLRNEGQTRLTEYAQFDVIAEYTSASGATSAWLPYVAGIASANTWTMVSISGDSFEPGLLNPGETAAIQIELSPDVAPASTNRIVIVSETGIAVSAPFTN